MKKVCPRCGMTFSYTGNQAAVIRMFLQLDVLQRNYIAENYDNCLCDNCVREIEEFFYTFSVNPHYCKKQKIQPEK